MSLLFYHDTMLTVHRDPESTARCSCGFDHHSAGSATRQSKTCLPVED